MYYLPAVGDRLPARGNRLTRFLGRTILRLWGWRFTGTLPNVPKLLIVVAPHTTAKDFFMGMVALVGIGIRVSWMGADWLFRFPFMRALGGVPIDRSQASGMVGQSIAEFAARDRFVLGIAPEGSRKKVPRWKSGFYHIAIGANVPLLLVAIDQKDKQVVLGPVLEAHGDFADVMAQIRPFYLPYVDKYPDNFSL